MTAKHPMIPFPVIIRGFVEIKGLVLGGKQFFPALPKTRSI